MKLHEQIAAGRWDRTLAATARATPIERQGAIAFSESEMRRYDFGAVLRARLSGDTSKAVFEGVINTNLLESSPFAVPGFLIPLGVVLGRDFNASEGAGLASAPRDFAHASDAPRAASVLPFLGVPAISGFVPGTVIPRMASAPAAAATTEIGAAGDGAATTSAHQIAAHRITVRQRLSRQADMQSPAGAAMVLGNLRRGLAAEIERLYFGGTGSDQPTGLRFASGVGAVVGGTDGAQVTFARLVDLENAPADDCESPTSGYAVNKATRKFLRTLPRASGLDFVWQSTDRPLLGHRVGVTANLPANLSKGSGSNLSAIGYSADWTMSFVAICGDAIGLTIDKFTRADRGEVVITGNLYIDVVFMRPDAFAVMGDAITA